MKKVNIFWYVIAVMVLVAGCSDSEIIELQEEQTIQQFPPRPDIGPGESTVKITSDKSQKITTAATGLVTTDLSVQTAEEMVAALIGTGDDAPIISNVSYVGANRAAGSFNGGTGIIGFDSGIILGTGDIAFVTGPNQYDGISGNNGLGGDTDLNTLIPGYSTYDATVLEFDFECATTQFLSFEYVFTSEEYNEYVNSEFNDVFAFYLNGENIALIPGTTIPVAINNVNCDNPYNPSGGDNCELFINNDLDDGGGAINTEMDGLTVVFTATGALEPGLNHIKLVIADAGDRILDSNVFIKAESFVCAETTINTDVAVDIHPGSCPNPLETKRGGVIPVSISGGEDFDVNDIDVSTITLEGVSPLRSAVEDVSTPYIMEDMLNLNEYDCHTLMEDGYYDLSLKFDTKEILSALGEVERGEIIYLTLSGELNDGTSFSGGDIMIIR